VSGRRTQNFELLAIGREFAQGATVEVEEFDQANKGVFGLSDHTIGRKIGERHGQVGDQALEGEAFLERKVRGVDEVCASGVVL
jgi:hypothetical protein